MRQTEETAMHVYNHGFAGFPELAAVVGAALRLDAHPLKDACAAARDLKGCLAHEASFRSFLEFVNFSDGPVCLNGKLHLSTVACLGLRTALE